MQLNEKTGGGKEAHRNNVKDMVVVPGSIEQYKMQGTTSQIGLGAASSAVSLRTPAASRGQRKRDLQFFFQNKKGDMPVRAEQREGS
jgi:hypothetical protein